MRVDGTDRSRADACEEELGEAILSGELAPGARLKMEMLRVRLGCGLSPIREALARLVQRGLIRAESNRGFVVEPLDVGTVRDLFEAYCSVESLLLSQAIDRGDVEWEAQVVAALHRLAAVERGGRLVSFREFQPANAAFHRALVGGCGSPVLLALRDNLYERFERCVRLAFDAQAEALELNHEEHRRLAEATLAREKGAALSELRSHVLGGVATVIERLSERGLL